MPRTPDLSGSVSGMAATLETTAMKSSPPLVSVIIIFLDTEEFIREAIESVYSQTYPEWELLLVDDGSTDGSTRLALQYAEQSSGKARYLEHEDHANRGMSASRNRGLAAANGELVAFLDADDVWLPRHLEVYVALMVSHPEAAMVYGRTQFWFSWTGRQEDRARDFVLPLGVRPGELLRPRWLFPLFLTGTVPVPSIRSVLIKRDVLRRLGGFEDTFRAAYEDQVFLAKVFLLEAAVATDACLDRYRQHPSSCTASSRKSRSMVEERRHFLNWIEQFLMQQGIEDPVVWQALRTSRWRLRHPLLARVARGFRRLPGCSRT